MVNEKLIKESDSELNFLKRRNGALTLTKNIELLNLREYHTDYEIDQILTTENIDTRVDTVTNENKKASPTCLYVLHFDSVFKVGISSRRNLKRRIYQNERVFKEIGYGKIDKRRSYIFTSRERHHLNYIEDVIKSKFNNVTDKGNFIGYTETYCLTKKPDILSLIRLLIYRLTTFLEMEIMCGCVIGENLDNFHELFPHLMNYKPELTHYNEHSYYEYFNDEFKE